MDSRRKSQKQERDIATAIGGRVTPGSGAFWHRKGDVSDEVFLIEAKMTDKASFSIKKEIWEKIRNEALLSDKVPVLMVRIQDRDLVVLDLEDFLAIAFKPVG